MAEYKNFLMEYVINRDILFKHIDKVGSDICCQIAMEECSELIQAISKCSRDKWESDHVESPRPAPWPSSEHRDNLEEEVADVLISIEMVKDIFDLNDYNINEWIRLKQKRQLARDQGMMLKGEINEQHRNEEESEGTVPKSNLVPESRQDATDTGMEHIYEKLLARRKQKTIKEESTDSGTDGVESVYGHGKIVDRIPNPVEHKWILVFEDGSTDEFYDEELHIDQ